MPTSTVAPLRGQVAKSPWSHRSKSNRASKGVPQSQKRWQQRFTSVLLKPKVKGLAGNNKKKTSSIKKILKGALSSQIFLSQK